jgi:GxxExxY protein
MIPNLLIMTKKEITQLSYEIIGCAIKVHKQLGPGLLESVYQKCMYYELLKNGFRVNQQIAVPIVYDKLVIEADLRLDLLVNDCIVVELKATEVLHPVYEAQVLSYMRLMEKPQGLLINFFTENITKSFKPLVNDIFQNLPD